MERRDLERQLGVRGGVLRVGVLKNETPTEVFRGIAEYGYRVILVMQSGLDPLTLEREKLLYLLKCCDSNFKKREELFEKYAAADDYEVVSLLLEHKLLTPAEVRRKTEWAAEKERFKIMPLLLSFAKNASSAEDSEKLLTRLKTELSGNKKGCVKHFKENAEEFDYDKELFLLAVRKDGTLLSYASPVLRGDREVALAALAADPGTGRPVLSFLSKKLYADGEIVTLALKNNPRSVTCLSEEAQKDRNTVKRALELNGAAYEYVGSEFQSDKELLLTALSSSNVYAKITDPALAVDPDVGVAAVRGNVDVMADPLFRSRFGKNAEVMLEALKCDARCMRYLSNDFKQDVAFAKRVAKIDKTLLSGFFYNVQKDPELLRLTEE